MMSYIVCAMSLYAAGLARNLYHAQLAGMLSEGIFTLTLNALNDAYSINAAILVLKEQLQILKVSELPLNTFRFPLLFYAPPFSL